MHGSNLRRHSLFAVLIYVIIRSACTVLTYVIIRCVQFGLCRPKLFNPYGQLSAAQALSFVGIVTVYGTMGTDWNDYWAPVWTAGLVRVFIGRVHRAKTRLGAGNPYSPC